MQQCIYMNNFRGFTDTTIPLKKVNFFVGENSTGKTSLLALLELLASPSFWLGGFNFNREAYEFGGYKDIVSVLSPDKTEFQIGLSNYDAKDSKKTVAFMLHFCQSKDGLPKLARISLLSTKYVATIRFVEEKIEVYSQVDVATSVDGTNPHAAFSYLREIPKSIMPEKYKKPSNIADRYLPSRPAFFPVFIMDILSHSNKELEKLIEYFPFPVFSKLFVGMAPIRTTPKRTYDGYTKMFSPEGEHTPYVIRKRLQIGSKKTNVFKKALDAFGASSGLFESVGITKFGKDSASPFELTITLSSKALRINSVGYGVSQVLPIIVELLTNKDAWLSIQQPEVHLHPRAQAALGDVLYHAATSASQTLFVETHSDYLIDRYRTTIRESKNFADSTQVIFFERTTTGNHAHIMALDRNGEYPIDQPNGFRSFFLKEQKRILGI